MRWLVFGIGLVFGAGDASACLWDVDTMREEKKASYSMFELVTGRIPHHGDAYYQARVKRLESLDELKNSEKNDLAVAKIRLGKFAEADVILTELLDANPDHYHTISNLGVLRKKQGKFEEAAELIKRALEINPEGHMGLGDWYHKQLLYRSQNQKSKRPPNFDFLGQAYLTSFNDYESFSTDDFSGPDWQYGNLEYLKKLIQNDRNFADAYLVLGDELVRRGVVKFAFVSYTKAKELGHPNPNEIDRRRVALISHMYRFDDRARSDPSKLLAIEAGKAKRELARGRGWNKMSR